MQLKIGEIAFLNAASQSRSTSEFFSECFVGLLLRESESETTSQPTFVFLCGIHQDGICCCRPSRLLCFVGDSVPDAAGRLACAVRAASVASRDVRSTCHVGCACFCCLFLLFFVDPNARVVGDQGHVFAQSARVFLSRKGVLFVSAHRSCGNDATATIIVVARGVLS